MTTRSLATVFVTGLWTTAVAASFLFLLDYKAVPGAAGAPPTAWPHSSVLKLADGQFTLVMVAHPRCPCTMASLESLAQLLGRNPQRIAAHVLFVEPDADAADWEQTSLWDRANNIPETSPLADPGGREAAKFGAATSGHVYLFRPDGRILFSGGITPARGHGGDCAGIDQLQRLLNETGTTSVPTPVFGCPLRDLGSKVVEGQ